MAVVALTSLNVRRRRGYPFNTGRKPPPSAALRCRAFRRAEKCSDNGETASESETEPCGSRPSCATAGDMKLLHCDWPGQGHPCLGQGRPGIVSSTA